MIQRFLFLNICFGFFFGGAGFALAQEPVEYIAETRQFHAPPGPPPVVEPEFGVSSIEEDGFTPSGTAVQYSIGDPTDEEQLNLEFINWARADAANAAQVYAGALAGPNSLEVDADVQGAYTFFNVDTGVMVTQFTTLSQTAQPLSFNPNLIEAARLHSQDQFNNIFQGHFSSSNPIPPNQVGFTLGQRVDAQMYSDENKGLGENVFARADSVWAAHVGFDVDWGDSGAFGMQVPPGHRTTIHDVSHREIGIGMVLGTNGVGTHLNPVGPVVVTQDFAFIVDGNPLITGVVYYDLNDNNFYDLGEGLPGVRVEITSIDDFFAITSTSGGYSVPVTGNGNYEVTFSTTGLADHVVMPTVSGDLNEKLDYIPTYSPPALSGPAVPGTGQNNAYTFNAVGGSDSYIVRQQELVAGDWVEGAENGLTDVTANVFGQGVFQHDAIQSHAAFSGLNGFQLVSTGFTFETVTLEREIIPSATSNLEFRSFHQLSDTGQFFRVQVSTDEGATWTTIFNQQGSSAFADTDSGYTLRSVSLSDFTDQTIKIRFGFEYIGGFGWFYDQQSFDILAGPLGLTQISDLLPRIGVYVDDIQVTDSLLVGPVTETEVNSGLTFNFNPSQESTFRLQVAAQSGQRQFPFGPVLEVEAQQGVNPFTPPELTILSVTAISGAQFEIHFKAVGGSNFGLSLHHADSPGGTFTDASLSALNLGNDEYKFTVTFPVADVKFYRVVASELVIN